MSIAQYIDHTILKPTTTLEEVKKLCSEAEEFGFAAVCIPPYYVQNVKDLLTKSNVKLATVIGFPFGYNTTRVKVIECKKAIVDGAEELDVVMNMAAFKNNDVVYLENEIKKISSITAETNTVLKVIIESGILSEEEIIKCCQLYQQYAVDFLKTSTGYAEKGATIEAVQLMREHLPSNMQIKASGGIKSYQFAKQLIEAGATRIGCSAGVQIVKEAGE